MKKGQEEYFIEGIIYGACLLVRLHDQPVMAANVIREAGAETWDCSQFDDFEKESLRIINKEKGMLLKGL